MAPRGQTKAVLMRRIGLSRRITLAILVAIAFIGKALVHYEKIPRPSSGWILLLLVAIGLLTLYDSILGTIRGYREPNKQRRSADLQKALFGALAELHDITKVPLADLGASVWLIKRPVPWLWDWARPSSWDWLQPRLVRVSRLRITDYPQPTDIGWTKGKGTIGRCWQLGKTQHDHLAPLARKYPQGMDQERFTRLASARTFNLTLEELNRIIHKYGEVLAVPMGDASGHQVGVVSVDITMGEHDDGQSAPVLNCRDAEKIVTTAAVLSQGVLASR